MMTDSEKWNMTAKTEFFKKLTVWFYTIMSENNKLCYEESLDDQLLAIISDDAIQSVISRRCKKQKINTKRVLVRCSPRAAT